MKQPLGFRTGDQSLVRDINLSLIMSRLFEHAPLSRAGLADATGLNKSTVSSLVKQLLDLQVVREVGFSLGSVGRPSVQLEINPAAGYIVSCELGVDYVEAICANFGAEVIWKQLEPIDTCEQDAIIEQMFALLHAALRASQTRCEGESCLLGLAVGVPGLASSADGSVLFAPHLGWKDFPLLRRLRDEFGELAIFVENEANMAALGEYFFGVAQGYREVLYLSAGSGLGGALIRDGVLCKGAAGFAGEFGHMTFDLNGPPCGCQNNGCWELYTNRQALFRAIREEIAAGRRSLLLELTGGDLDALSVPLVVRAAAQGDRLTLDALAQIGRYLGIGIASLLNALNPDLIVLGGELSLAAEYMLPALESELVRRALPWNLQAAEFRRAEYGTEACAMGGVALIYQHILSRPGTLKRWNR